MGFSKLREWVGTVTGKGDRWGRDKLGRSEPAFLSANTFALPPSTCTARREAGQRHLRLLCAARPANCWLFVCVEACAGRRVHRLCCLQRPGSAGCVPARLCHAIPTALHKFMPPFILFAPCPFHVRQDHHTNSLQAARLSCWQLQHGPAVAARAPVFDFFFSCRVHDPGPWV